VGLPVVTRSLAIPFFAPKCCEVRTVGGTLGDRLLATTTADAYAVDDITLFGLVSEAAGLVGTRGPRGTVDDVQLAELY